MNEFSEFLIEEMNERGMTAEELTQASEIMREKVERLINGDLPMSPEIADGLAKAFNVPAIFFIDLDRLASEDKNA